MGAETFFTYETGKNAREAFSDAVEEARHWNGHGGYTGTIAEKTEFTMIDIPDGKEAEDYAQFLIDAGDCRVDDKWGPAGCIKVAKHNLQLEAGMNQYLFFGWASS